MTAPLILSDVIKVIKHLHALPWDAEMLPGSFFVQHKKLTTLQSVERSLVLSNLASEIAIAFQACDIPVKALYQRISYSPYSSNFSTLNFLYFDGNYLTVDGQRGWDAVEACARQLIGYKKVSFLGNPENETAGTQAPDPVIGKAVKEARAHRQALLLSASTPAGVSSGPRRRV